jgi:myosin heavy subunit
MHDSWRTNSREIIRQLRCSGVIDVVRMRKFGFSLRLTYDKFVERYGILVKTKKPDHLACCKEIVRFYFY